MNLILEFSLFKQLKYPLCFMFDKSLFLREILPYDERFNFESNEKLLNFLIISWYFLSTRVVSKRLFKISFEEILELFINKLKSNISPFAIFSRG